MLKVASLVIFKNKKTSISIKQIHMHNTVLAAPNGKWTKLTNMHTFILQYADGQVTKN